MNRKQKLELTWIGKENRPRLEPRILLEDPEKSHHAAHRVTENDQFDNRLIFGDNLLALKALEAEFAGKVKCVYIDPPYNTGSAFAQYEDGLEHAVWLSLMRDRLEQLARHLRPDGSCWVQLDDNEAHYCRVLMDEIFDRHNFVANIVWNKFCAVRSNAEYFSTAHEPDSEGRIWWGPRGDSAPRLKLFLSDSSEAILPKTLWADGDVFGLNQQGVRELRALGLPDFPTPKPERLINKILELATSPGDLVLDSFAGSGTTGAVAHKMGRRWIMVELGEHCHTHIIPRLKKVIDADPGGVIEATGWKGGGGYRYCRLAPSLLEKDKWGNWVISKEFNPAMLAEAVCKLEGFQYAPSDSLYWQQGHSTERDFIYVTTQSLNADQLQQLSDEFGPERSLLVLCTAFRGKAERYPNLTVKKLPKAVLSRCEWGYDDYSLSIENLPKAPPKPGQIPLFEPVDSLG